MGRPSLHFFASSCLRVFAFFFVAAAPTLADVDATQAGAIGDGVTLNTASIQKAIDTCSASGGGIIRFPAGKYLTGSLQLKDGVTLHLDDQAVILGSTKPPDYLNLEPFVTGDGGIMGQSLIIAIAAKNVGIEGPGTIDGQGKTYVGLDKRKAMRPFLVRWVRCSNVIEKDVHLTYPGAWTNVFFQCEHVAVENVTIRSRTKGLANTDGIDIDSSQGVTIRNCDIQSGDDSLCLKTTSPKPCSDITISGCTLATHTSTIKIGTESLGDFEHINISNCKVTEAGFGGISLYSVDGADLHDVHISDITMDHVCGAINLRLGSRLKTFHPGDTAKSIGKLRDITIQNIRATNISEVGILLNGIPDHRIENITFSNLDLETVGDTKAADAQIQLAEKPAAYPEVTMFGKTMPVYGIYARHVQGVRFDNVVLHTTVPDARPSTQLTDVLACQPADFGQQPLLTPTTRPIR
jgi:polygalacturonase